MILKKIYRRLENSRHLKLNELVLNTKFSIECCKCGWLGLGSYHDAFNAFYEHDKQCDGKVALIDFRSENDTILVESGEEGIEPEEVIENLR